MRYLSTFSGIEAASVAWHPLGWEPVGFSEIDPFASAVLEHRFPGVPNYGDITKHPDWGLEPGSVDLLVGGSPCQAFSVAGLRKGLDDPRGQLTLVYLQLAARLQPEWIVWENVPGVLSADGGRAFSAFLGALAELGYGFAYRVLDARHFGVPQRRRRVFLVARRAGDWQSCAKVLLEPQGLRGDLEASGEAREDVASDARGCPSGGGIVYGGSDQRVSDTVCAKWSKGSGGPSGSECGLYVAHPDLPAEMSTLNRQSGGTTLCNQSVDEGCYIPFMHHSHGGYREGGYGSLRAAGGDLGGGSETLVAIQGNLIGRNSGGPQGVGASDSGTMYTLTRGDVHGVAFPIQDGRAMEKAQTGIGVGSEGDPSYTLDTTGSQAVAFRKSKRAQTDTDDETWVDDGLANTLNGFDTGDVRTTHVVAFGSGGSEYSVAFTQNQRDEVRSLGECAGTISGPGTHQTTYIAQAIDVYNQTIDGDCTATVTAAAGGTNTSGPKILETPHAFYATGGSHGLENHAGICPPLKVGSGLGIPSPPAVVFVTAFAENFDAVKEVTEVPCMTTTGYSPFQNAGGCGIIEGDPVAFKTGNSAKARSNGESTECSPTLGAQAGGNTVPAVASAMVVRRLTPVECERLQGFPDNWTRIPYRNKGEADCPDGPRYKALGNSMAVPCMAWIGRRIQMVMEGKL